MLNNIILATTSSFGKSSPELIRELKDFGFTLVTNPYKRKLTELELAALLETHKPIGMLAGVEPITRACLAAAAGFLKIISRVGVGWDNVDHETAAELGIKVFRTAGVLDQAVAELTLGFMLNALRNISLHDREIRTGKWEKYMGSLLQNKVVGIIGYGAIGQKVGEICNAFGARVIFADICGKDSLCAVCVSVDALLKQSDIISIHASGCDRILTEAELINCKPGVIIINTARGGQIDEDALYHLLKSGHIGYACLDVFREEPYSGPLVEMRNVIMTTHIGSYAREARIQMEELAVHNLLKGLGASE